MAISLSRAIDRTGGDTRRAGQGVAARARVGLAGHAARPGVERPQRARPTCLSTRPLQGEEALGDNATDSDCSRKSVRRHSAARRLCRRGGRRGRRRGRPRRDKAQGPNPTPIHHERRGAWRRMASATVSLRQPHKHTHTCTHTYTHATLGFFSACHAGSSHTSVSREDRVHTPSHSHTPRTHSRTHVHTHTLTPTVTHSGSGMQRVCVQGWRAAHWRAAVCDEKGREGAKK